MPKQNCSAFAIRSLLVTGTALLMFSGMSASASPRNDDRGASYDASASEPATILTASQTLSALPSLPQSPGRAGIAGIVDRATDRASELVISALSLVGVNYKRGGTSPATGLDCSGMVAYVYKGVLGMSLPHRAEEISRIGASVPKAELKPGDLVFYNTLRRTFSHVGIYLGEGRFIHAPASGGEVRVEDMNLPYWTKRFSGARRIESTAANP